MQHSNVPDWFLRVVGFMRPCVHSERGRMPDQIKNLDNPLPDRFTLKYFFHWHAFNVCRVRVM